MPAFFSASRSIISLHEEGIWTRAVESLSRPKERRFVANTFVKFSNSAQVKDSMPSLHAVPAGFSFAYTR